MVWGYVAVVKATVTVPGAFPHGPGAPPASVGYNVQPAGIWFDPAKPTPIVVELHDPGAGDHRYIKKLAGQTGPRSFSWGGDLYIYDANDNITSGPFYCTASTVFAKIHVSVRDLYWFCFGYYTIETPKTLTFKSPGLAIRWHSYGYLGQKQTYEALVQDQVSGAIQWSCTGNPGTGQGQFFSTRFFSAGQKTITAAATVRAEIDWVSCQATWSTQIADIFCHEDGGREYAGKYPGNPNFGVYASRLIAGNAWNTAYVNLDGDGNPTSSKFNTGWYNLFRASDLASDPRCKANNLRNSQWVMSGENVVLATPWYPPAGNGDLQEFNWRGHMVPQIISEAQYPTNQNKVKSYTTANCHGNSAHCFGVMSLWLLPGQVGPSLAALGATFTEVEPVLVEEVMNHIQAGGIIFFHLFVPLTGQKPIVHSAYVVSVEADENEALIWACNAGMSTYETTSGFDMVILEEYLWDHSEIKYVSFYNNIHKP